MAALCAAVGLSLAHANQLQLWSRVLIYVKRYSMYGIVTFSTPLFKIVSVIRDRPIVFTNTGDLFKLLLKKNK